MKKRWIALLLVSLMGALCFLPGLSEGESDSLRLICLNIGKADCMLLLYADEAYLIDTGYAQTYAALETMLAQYGVTHLNGVFLTHCHKDHFGGLMLLAKSGVAVDAWYAPRIYYDVDKAGHPAQLAAAARNESVSWLDAGDVISVGGGGSFTVLGPLSMNTDNENNNSLVMRFACPHGSILFTGDMKNEEEYELLSAGAFTGCDVLKAGHHGDNNATGKDMLKIVQPKAALILTSSQEEADTPATATLRRLSGVGCEVYVSQDFHDAMMVTLQKGSDPKVEDVLWSGVPERAENISLSMDVSDDALTIYNNGAVPLSLSGMTLYSSKGEETLALPDDEIAPGASYTIGTKSSSGEYDFKWNDKKVWNQKKLDMAILYDAYGRPLARTDNGLEE